MFRHFNCISINCKTWAQKHPKLHELPLKLN